MPNMSFVLHFISFLPLQIIVSRWMHEQMSEWMNFEPVTIIVVGRMERGTKVISSPSEPGWFSRFMEVKDVICRVGGEVKVQS